MLTNDMVTALPELKAEYATPGVKVRVESPREGRPAIVALTGTIAVSVALEAVLEDGTPTLIRPDEMVTVLPVDLPTEPEALKTLIQVSDATATAIYLKISDGWQIQGSGEIVSWSVIQTRLINGATLCVLGVLA